MNNPAETRRKLNIHKTFNLRPVSTLKLTVLLILTPRRKKKGKDNPQKIYIDLISIRKKVPTTIKTGKYF